MDTQYCVHNKKEDKLMAKAYIKNEFVNMPWEADGFFESKKNGFLGACHVYSGTKGDVVVMFADNRAFILLGEDDLPAGVEDYFEAAKEANSAGALMPDYFEDLRIDLSNGVTVDEENLELYGLSSEDGLDIIARLDDLADYWQSYTID